MTEKEYDIHDTVPIKIPRVTRTAPRDEVKFIDRLPVWSKEAAERREKKLREFDTLNPGEHDGIRNFELLRIGDVLHVPDADYNDAGEATPGAFVMRRYVVSGISEIDGKLKARLKSGGGIEDVIDADVFAGQSKDLNNLKRVPDDPLGAAIAQRLINIEGIDIHHPDTKLIEDNEETE